MTAPGATTAPAPVGQVLTGTQVPLDAAYIANLAAQNNLTARGQDVSMRGQDLSYAAAMQDATNQLAQIRAQYMVDVANLGLNTAQLNYQQRVAQLNAALQTVTTASQERQAAANTKLAAIQALASRSGPQDWVQYARLLAGLGKATGQTTTVDPTAIADAIISPQLQQAASGLNLTGFINGAYQPYAGSQLPADVPGATTPSMQPPATTPVRDFNSSGVQQGGGTGIVPGATGTGGGNTYGVVSGLPYTPDGSVTKPYVPDAGASPGVADYSGVPIGDVSGLTQGQWKMVTTGAAGPSKVSDYKGFNVYLGGSQLAPDNSIDPRTPIWLQKLAQGGYMHAPMAIVGEGHQPGRTGLGDSGELVMNPTGAPVGVLNHEQARAMLARDVTPKSGKKGKPKRYSKGTKVPGYASGTYVGINPNALEYTTYTPQQLGSQPFIQQLQGQRATTPFRGFGATIAAPDLGIYNFDPRLNLQNYMQMDPSQQDMTQGLYGGLGLDFRDFLKQAQAAAPTTSDYSTYGMRQQPTQYGG